MIPPRREYRTPLAPSVTGLMLLFVIIIVIDGHFFSGSAEFLYYRSVFGREATAARHGERPRKIHVGRRELALKRQTYATTIGSSLSRWSGFTGGFAIAAFLILTIAVRMFQIERATCR